jgi:hypothetical protein
MRKDTPDNDLWSLIRSISILAIIAVIAYFAFELYSEERTIYSGGAFFANKT